MPGIQGLAPDPFPGCEKGGHPRILGSHATVLDSQQRLRQHWAGVGGEGGAQASVLDKENDPFRGSLRFPGGSLKFA